MRLSTLDSTVLKLKLKFIKRLLDELDELLIILGVAATNSMVLCSL